jgi:hypothetical protein
MMALALGVPRTKSSTHPRVGASSQTSLSAREKQIVLGTVLGDSSISYPDKLYSRYPRLSYNHGICQLAYAKWKAQSLPSLSATGREVANDGYGERLWQAHTVCHPWLEAVHRMCYSEGKKTVTTAWLNTLGPLAIAVWVMDDGACQDGQLFMHTEGFAEAENQLTQAWFAALGFSPRVDRTRTYFFLRFPTADTREIARQIRPHMHPAMLYKLPSLGQTDIRKADIPHAVFPARPLPDHARPRTDSEWDEHVRLRTCSPEHLAYLEHRKALRRARLSR